MKIRVCVFDGDCSLRMEPVDGADGMLSRSVCCKKNMGPACKLAESVDVDKLVKFKGVADYCGGFRADSLLLMGRSSLVDFLPLIKPFEYDVLFSWARDFARRGIPFYVVRRGRGSWVSMIKRSSC